MTRFVLDCSVTMAWCFQEKDSSAAMAVLDALEPDGAVVPSIWPLEVANVLALSERKGRLGAVDIARFLSLLGALPITIDAQTSDRALGDVLTLARTHQITAYDAAYLELAAREAIPLATLDDTLASAAAKVGVNLLAS